MVVICSKCKKDILGDYEFVNIGNDILPVCLVCVRGEELEKTLVEIHEERLERAWNNKDTKLDGWL